jgi:hypothetical protein
MAVQISLVGKNPETVVRQIDQNLRAELPKVGKLKLASFFQRVLVKMKGDGRAISYPVKWDSDKQRRAFFATDGFGRGIPTGRSGAYQGGWSVREEDNGMSLVNSAEHAQYVGGLSDGTGQSRIHADRWRLLQYAFNDEYAKLPGEMQSALIEAANRVVSEAVQ